MNMLFYRYGSICEPDLIDGFRALGLTVTEETTEITNKKLTGEQRVTLLQNAFQKEKPLFVFSVNFYPIIAEVCHIYHILYLCLTVDAPVPELFSKAITYDTNRIFLFDQGQMRDFEKYNPGHIFHLPLYSAVERFDKIIHSISASDIAKYSHDIAFIGSLYSEKNPLRPLLPQMSDYLNGYVRAIVDASMKVYGYNFTKETMSAELIDSLKTLDQDFYQLPDAVCNIDSYIAAHSYIGMHIAQEERITTLNTLAKHFKVDLYTLSDTSPLKGVTIHKGANSLTEMPKIFHLSKININPTVRPIQDGLPLRIFDILGCGGFLMTNFQSELLDHFEIGVDLEAYSSIDELVDKCAFYLSHDDIRKKIAENGYKKVSLAHTTKARLTEMIRHCV